MKRRARSSLGAFPLAALLAALFLAPLTPAAATPPDTLPAAILFADDFNAGRKPEWQTWGGDWTVADGRYVQRAALGEAISWPAGVVCTDCDVSATLLMPSAGASAGEGSIGLVARMTDVDNLYLADFRFISREVRVWKRLHGAWSPLQIKPFALAYDRAYNYRFVLQGNTLQVFVDGALQIQVTDSAFAVGQAGLRASQAYATYDNFSLAGTAPAPPPPTPTPAPNRLFYDGFDGASLSPVWQPVGQWRSDAGTLVQSLTGNYGNVLAWPEQPYCADCSAAARARLDGGGGGELGLVLRALDNDTYYLFDIRYGSAEARLWRRQAGGWHFLAAQPFPVEMGRWYELRFDATGSSLKGYVDGKLVVQAQDTHLSAGRAGLRTCDAVGRYDWFVLNGKASSFVPTPTPTPATAGYADLMRCTSSGRRATPGTRKRTGRTWASVSASSCTCRTRGEFGRASSICAGRPLRPTAPWFQAAR